MAAITYTASSRAPLVTSSPAHAAGSSYSIDLKLREYLTTVDQPRTQHTAISGSVETVLQRATKIYQVTFIWPHSENADVEEFLFSVSGGETFSFDPFGTVASSDDPFDVKQVGGNLSIQRMSHGSSPWRMVSMALRPVPV